MRINSVKIAIELLNTYLLTTHTYPLANFQSIAPRSLLTYLPHILIHWPISNHLLLGADHMSLNEKKFCQKSYCAV